MHQGPRPEGQGAKPKMLINKLPGPPPPIAKGWRIKFSVFLTNYAIREGGAIDPQGILDGNDSFLPYVAP